MSAESELSCSFANICHSGCGTSTKSTKETNFIPISSCTRNVKPHLCRLNVSQSSISSEKDLILARAGLFEEEGNSLTICPKHRDTLGLQWKPTKKCNHPLHRDSKRKPDRGANLQTSKEVMAKWEVLLPIGAGL